MSTPRFLTLPPGVSRTTVETSRGAFAALEALPGSGVPDRWPALLVPGLTGSKEDFLAVLQTLAASGRRVVAVDMRGQYESIGPDDDAAYTRAALGADIASLLDVLGPDPVHLVGHSFGGLVCRETVLSGALPASLTLMSSGPAAATGQAAAKARALRDALPELGLAQIWELALEPDYLGRGVEPEILAFLRARTVGNSPKGLARMADELLTAPDRVEELTKHCADSGLRTLVLYGEDDDVWEPPVQAAMAENLNAAKVVIPGAAHSPAWDAPETTAAALRTFWTETEQSLK
ncbi:Pimeloyl-ACP methyl ester carboxylesterase [Actinomadura meyerae]|uniref:Pimeloyl-ACP methyl ester carboxylesterase n=1 Tax=Actinomadura meyerae TaxID=240840 RepID=A0A239FHL9_9ACTN|nr:alpha/beta hydrolase [Actinomadura meyerae]SNS56028.1 Pimeloyl-ACP methyl ester carboxylesterase [Actinomadura meyerae]